MGDLFKLSLWSVWRNKPGLFLWLDRKVLQYWVCNVSCSVEFVIIKVQCNKTLLLCRFYGLQRTSESQIYEIKYWV